MNITYRHAIEDHEPEPEKQFSAPESMIIQPGTFKGTTHELRALILEQITSFPEDHHQGSFASFRNRDSLSRNVCRTTMCIAGYAQAFVRGHVDMNTVEEDAAKLLGLDPWDANQLFYCFDNDDAVQRLRDLVEE